MVNKILKIRFISVNYHNRFGGICPECGEKNCDITRTLPWLSEQRLRYHKCKCGKTFSSIEEEMPLLEAIKSESAVTTKNAELSKEKNKAGKPQKAKNKKASTSRRKAS